MNLEQRIQKEMVVAMKAKDQDALAVLRAIKSAILIAKTESGAQAELDESQGIKLLQRLKKQRQDAASIYQEQNREDLASDEIKQIAIIDAFLPAQLSADDLKQIITDIIEQTGASSMKDMGKVMGMANQKLAGSADGKAISSMVKELLNA